jgi:predicted O-methyltransferase YrrM
LAGTFLWAAPAAAQMPEVTSELDRRVRDFLQEHRRSWRDMNVPAVDGRKMFDLIVENGYTRALEIGTSTGHSGIWIAWALSRTGGRLVTIEIDERRHAEAVGHFEEAGLSEFVDARLADAHELVPALEERFDFVFIDADKDWYTNYLDAVLPKVDVGGCITAHNVSPPRGSGARGRRGRGRSGTGAFVEALMGKEALQTTFFMEGGGLSVSLKQPPEPPQPPEPQGR